MAERKFLFKPGDRVRIVMLGLDLRGEVHSCIWSRGINTYKIEYRKDDDSLAEATFYGDQLSADTEDEKDS